VLVSATGTSGVRVYYRARPRSHATVLDHRDLQPNFRTIGNEVVYCRLNSGLR